VQALQRRLTRDEQRDVLIGALAKIAGQFTNWRDQCKQHEPAVYVSVAQTLVERGVKLLTDADFANEARRLADGKTPPSGQFQARDCSPNDANAQASYGVQGRLIVLDEVITELRR
jgi:hypothetical protein